VTEKQTAWQHARDGDLPPLEAIREVIGIVLFGAVTRAGRQSASTYAASVTHISRTNPCHASTDQSQRSHAVVARSGCSGTLPLPPRPLPACRFIANMMSGPHVCRVSKFCSCGRARYGVSHAQC